MKRTLLQVVLPSLIALSLIPLCALLFQPRFILPKTPRIRGTTPAEAPFHPRPDPSPPWLRNRPPAHHILPRTPR